ncbi:MAG: PucR family transcriptional regulator [Chloroflexi bacterium]|nr:PucR family transcriptional regulator [Chloroflexota bacterium]
MPLITVHDALRLALPVSTRVVAGHSGLQRHVTWPAVARAVAPIFSDLRGGEFALVSILSLRDIDPPLSLAVLVERLSSVPVSAVTVVGNIDAKAIEIADIHQIPLVQCANDVDIREIERELQRLISDYDAQLERRAAQIALELGELSLAGGGIGVMATTLAQRTGRHVAIFSDKGDLLVTDEQNPHVDLIRQYMPRAGSTQVAGLEFWCHPLVAVDHALGYTVLIGPTLAESDRQTVRRASMALALELTKNQALNAVEARYRGNFVEQLLSGQLTDQIVIQQRARELGFDVRQPHCAVIIAVPVQQIPALQTQFSGVLHDVGLSAPWIVHTKGVMLFVPKATNSAPFITELWSAVSSKFPQLRMTIGRSVASTADWHRSVQEAEQVLRLPKPSQAAPMSYDTVGVFQLLLPMAHTSETMAFYRAHLGPLLDYDREQRGELLHTLEAYFDCAGNLARTAELIHVHRNTLLYRLSRISQICHVALDDSETRLSLWLAVKLHHILAHIEESN